MNILFLDLIWSLPTRSLNLYNWLSLPLFLASARWFAFSFYLSCFDFNLFILSSFDFSSIRPGYLYIGMFGSLILSWLTLIVDDLWVFYCAPRISLFSTNLFIFGRSLDLDALFIFSNSFMCFWDIFIYWSLFPPTFLKSLNFYTFSVCLFLSRISGKLSFRIIAGCIRLKGDCSWIVTVIPFFFVCLLGGLSVW